MQGSLVRGAFGVLLLTLGVGCSDDPSLLLRDGYPRDTELRLNHIQVLGTHNSYHVQPKELLLMTLRGFRLDLALAWEYTHLPLPEQFEKQGIRQIELDVFADPEGGLFANRVGQFITTGMAASGIPDLDEPGFKVLHVQDLDFESTCWTFVQCLEMVKAWSDEHPGHVPIMILVEAKDDPIPDPASLGFVAPVAIGTQELDAIDAEIRSVFPPEQIITPDEVRGERGTLEEAVAIDGWPTLGETRGRVLFALDNEDAKKDAYITDHPSLAGRIMFTSSLPGEPDAAFVKLNDPIADFDLIQELVADGFVIRTRADADTVEARSGDTMRRDAALASGAQFVSTDYPVPNPDFGIGYRVQIPTGSPARCNPISAPPDCHPLDIEDPQLLSF